MSGFPGCDLTSLREHMARRLRQNLTDASVRSAVAAGCGAGGMLCDAGSPAQARRGLQPVASTPPRSPRAPAAFSDVQQQLAAPNEWTPTPTRLTGSCRNSPSARGSPGAGTLPPRKACRHAEYYTHKWPPATQAAPGPRLRARPVYVASLNHKPIILRGGGLRVGPAGEEEAGAGGAGAGDAEAQRADAANDLTMSTALESSSTIESVATPTTTPPATTRITPCLSLSLTATGGVADDDSVRELQAKLQETVQRLSALEAEHRLIFDSTVGALAKASCTMERGTGSSCSTTGNYSAAPKYLLDTAGVAADITALTVAGVSTAGTFLGRITPTMRSSSAPSTGSASTLGDSQRHSFEPGQLSVYAEHMQVGELEDENRSLRDAVARALLRNVQLAVQQRAVEARCQRLEEENRRATQGVLLDLAEDCDGAAAALPADAHSVVAATVPAASEALRSVVATGEPTAAAGAEEEQARAALLTASAKVELGLKGILARRGNIQEFVRSAACEA